MTIFPPVGHPIVVGVDRRHFVDSEIERVARSGPDDCRRIDHRFVALLSQAQIPVHRRQPDIGWKPSVGCRVPVLTIARPTRVTVVHAAGEGVVASDE